MRLILAFLLLSILVLGCSKGKPMPEHRVIYDPDNLDHLNLRHTGEMTMAQYNSELYIKGQTYNGKLMVKRYNNDDYKLAYTTDSGFKLYALAITDTSIHWDYCYSKMNNKFVKKVLERNFRGLLALVPPVDQAKTSREDKPHSIIGGPDENVYIYWTDNTKTKVYKTLYTNGKEVQVVAHYLKYENGFPYRIKVADHLTQMTMTLVLSD